MPEDHSQKNGADAAAESASSAPNTCPVCGGHVLAARHCKVQCENCGYVESCEDLFPDVPASPPAQTKH